MLGNGGGSSRRVDPRDCIGGTQPDYCAGMGPTVLPAPGEQVKGDFCATVSMTNLQFGPCSSKKISFDRQNTVHYTERNPITWHIDNTQFIFSLRRSLKRGLSTFDDRTNHA